MTEQTLVLQLATNNVLILVKLIASYTQVITFPKWSLSQMKTHDIGGIVYRQLYMSANYFHALHTQMKWIFECVHTNTEQNFNPTFLSLIPSHLLLDFGLGAWERGYPKDPYRHYYKPNYIKHRPSLLTYPSQAQRLWLCPCYQHTSSVLHFLPPRLCAEDHGSETKYQQLSWHRPLTAPPCCSEGEKSCFYCCTQILSPASLY